MDSTNTNTTKLASIFVLVRSLDIEELNERREDAEKGLVLFEATSGASHGVSPFEFVTMLNKSKTQISLLTDVINMYNKLEMINGV